MEASRPSQSAHADAAALAAVATVDAARLKNVTQLYSELRLAPGEAQARAFLFCAFIFGQTLLMFEQAPGKQASLAAGYAEFLTEVKEVN